METDNERNLKRQVENYRNEILLQIDRNHKCEEELKQYKENYNELSQIYRDSTLEYNKIIDNLKKENDLLKNEVKDLKKRTSIQSTTSPMTSSQISENCATTINHFNSIRIERVESCNSRDSQEETPNYDRNVKTERDSDVTQNNVDDSDGDIILLSNENESSENSEPSAPDVSSFNNLQDAPGVLHSCPCCPLKTIEKRHLKQHFFKLHVHSKYRSKLVYKCHICNGLFNDVNKLAVHLPSTHSDKDAFKCEECGCLFKHANQRHIHTLKHRREATRST